jgi:hypothetical protein
MRTEAGACAIAGPFIAQAIARGAVERILA